MDVCLQDPLPNASAHEWLMPYETLTVFVQTLSQLTSCVASHLWWPCNKAAFLKDLVVAFERIVPGVFFAIRSSKPPPERFSQPVVIGR